MKEADVIRFLTKSCRGKKLKFFAHVNDGSPYSKQQRILDGFAVKPVYEKMITYGYEIKVSRSDFLRDIKWQEYLPVCNFFYFVCPVGIIDPKDLPDGIGLMHVLDSGVIEYIKKAKHREVDQIKLFEVFKYLIFHRCLSERETIKAAIKEKNRIKRELNESKIEQKRLQDGYYDLRNELYELKRCRRQQA